MERAACQACEAPGLAQVGLGVTAQALRAEHHAWAPARAVVRTKRKHPGRLLGAEVFSEPSLQAAQREPFDVTSRSARSSGQPQDQLVARAAINITIPQGGVAPEFLGVERLHLKATLNKPLISAQ